MIFHQCAFAPRGRAVIRDEDVTADDFCVECSPVQNQRRGATVCIGVSRLDSDTAPAPTEGRACAECATVLVAATCYECKARGCICDALHDETRHYRPARVGYEQ